MKSHKQKNGWFQSRRIFPYFFFFLLSKLAWIMDWGYFSVIWFRFFFSFWKVEHFWLNGMPIRPFSLCWPNTHTHTLTRIQSFLLPNNWFFKEISHFLRKKCRSMNEKFVDSSSNVFTSRYRDLSIGNALFVKLRNCKSFLFSFYFSYGTLWCSFVCHIHEFCLF